MHWITTVIWESLSYFLFQRKCFQFSSMRMIFMASFLYATFMCWCIIHLHSLFWALIMKELQKSKCFLHVEITAWLIVFDFVIYFRGKSSELNQHCISGMKPTWMWHFDMFFNLVCKYFDKVFMWSTDFCWLCQKWIFGLL